MRNTEAAVAKYNEAMLNADNEAKFGPSSGERNCKLSEMPNYAELRADYIAAFDELNDREIDTLTRNELALIRTTSNGAIKSAQQNGKCAYDVLTGVKAARGVSVDTAVAKLAGLDAAQLEAIIAKLRKV